MIHVRYVKQSSCNALEGRIYNFFFVTFDSLEGCNTTESALPLLLLYYKATLPTLGAVGSPAGFVWVSVWTAHEMLLAVIYIEMDILFLSSVMFCALYAICVARLALRFGAQPFSPSPYPKMPMC